MYPEILNGFAPAFFAIIGIQVLVMVSMFFTLHRDAKEKAQLNKECFGLMKKIEGLTANRREQVAKHYDKMLETLSNRLPTIVAAEASALIYETEKKILMRLAELEPTLKDDKESQKKMDDLIKTLENLEQTIVNLTAHAVKRVMVEGRRSVLDGQENEDVSLAA